VPEEAQHTFTQEIELLIATTLIGTMTATIGRVTTATIGLLITTIVAMMIGDMVAIMIVDMIATGGTEDSNQLKERGMFSR